MLTNANVKTANILIFKVVQIYTNSQPNLVYYNECLLLVKLNNMYVLSAAEISRSLRM